MCETAHCWLSKFAPFWKDDDGRWKKEFLNLPSIDYKPSILFIWHLHFLGLKCAYLFNFIVFDPKSKWGDVKHVFLLRLSWGKNAALSFDFEVLKSFTNCVSLYSVSLLLTSVWYFDNFWSSYGEVMGQLLSKLAMVGAPDADSRNEMEKMSRQIQDYEILVKQLKVWPSTEVPPLTVYKWSISVSCINKFRLLVRLSTLGSSLFWTSGFYDSILTHRS